MLLTAGVLLCCLPAPPGKSQPLEAEAMPGLREGLLPSLRMTAQLPPADLLEAISAYEELTGRTFHPARERPWHVLDRRLGYRLSRIGWVKRRTKIDHRMYFHADGLLRASEVKEALEEHWKKAGLVPREFGERFFVLQRIPGGDSAEKK